MHTVCCAAMVSDVVLWRFTRRMEGHRCRVTKAVKSIFSDVISASAGVVLQLKCESWKGEFLDIKEADSIPNQAVVRVIVEEQFSKVGRYIIQLTVEVQ